MAKPSKQSSKPVATSVARKTGTVVHTENSAKSSAKSKRGNPAKTEPYRFQPGQSGNPGGRPRKLVSDAYQRVLEQEATYGKQKGTGADLLAAKMWRQAMNGKIQAAVELADRVEGKAIQGHEVSGPGGGAIPLTSMTPEENEKRIMELQAKWGGFKE
jgi:hypothetical protein